MKTHVLQIVHMAQRLRPLEGSQVEETSAAGRIVSLFLDLLERQFPIDEMNQQVRLRTPADFARQLNIHVNHLNKTLQETLQKSTSTLIAERLLQEARILLKHTSWTISEIAFALGFHEASHFSHFFKKNLALSPSQFRNI
jgi:AraC-like DNA-binding protein